MEKKFVEAEDPQPPRRVGSSVAVTLLAQRSLNDQEAEHGGAQALSELAQKQEDNEDAAFIQSLRAPEQGEKRESYELAWQKLYLPYSPYVCQRCYCTLIQWMPKARAYALAKECADKTFVRAFFLTNENDFDGRTHAQLRKWLGKIAYFVCQEEYGPSRRNTRLVSLSVVAAEEAQDGDASEIRFIANGGKKVRSAYMDDPFEDYVKNEYRQEIESVLEEVLSPKERKMVHLHYIEGMKYQEIIEELNLSMTLGAFKTTMSRIRRRLRKFFRERGLYTRKETHV